MNSLENEDPASSRPAELPPGSHRPSVRRASLWVIGGYAAAQGLRLVGNLVLWRLLFPEAFGIMAIVNVFIQGLQMFSDVGVAPSIIQSARGDEPAFLNTAWTIQVIRGVLLCLAAAALSGTVAAFYDVPELSRLIPVVALTTVLQGFYSTGIVTAKRKLALGRLTAVELVAQATGLAVMVVAAWWTRSIWSLVVGGLAANLTQLLLSHTVLPGVRNRLRWEPAHVRALVRFGRWIFLSTVLSFAVLHSDRLIFGKLVSLEALGVYSVAAVWGVLPRVIIGHVCGSVVFPVLSRAHNEGGDFSPTFARTRLPWLLLAGWMATCLFGGSSALIHFLYDERAYDAIWIMQLLAAGAWFASLDSINQTAVMARGRPEWMVVSNFAKLVGMVVLIPLGYELAGFGGAVAGLAATEIVSYLSTLVGLLRLGNRPTGDVTASLFVAVIGALAVALERSAAPAFERWLGSGSRATAFVEGTVILIATTAAWALTWRLTRALPRFATPSPR